MSVFNKKYADYHARLFTFYYSTCPLSCLVSSDKLAQAGFYHHEDTAKCFYCNAIVSQMATCDDPWTMHRLVSPKCGFLLLNDPLEQVNDVSIDSPVVRDFLASSSECSEQTMKRLLTKQLYENGEPFRSLLEIEEAFETFKLLR